MSLVERRGSRVKAGWLRFTFDGREYLGQEGDTAASALLANGVRLFGRSVKYRRPRGVLAAGPEEPNALFTVGRNPVSMPNISAPLLQLSDGMVLRSQNRWPTLAVDLASLLQAGQAIFGAGFYYKTFMWPSWKLYEPIIRALAGLGEAPGACALPAAGAEHLSCDVLVAGGGAAGLSAALTASRAGAHVVLCEREAVCGGELDFEAPMIGGRPAVEWIAATLAALSSRGARLLTSSVLVGGADGSFIVHTETSDLSGPNRILYIRARAVVSAMGAVERPIAFIDNDRPGVMLLGAAERYLARYGVAVGRNVIVFGNNDRIYAAANRLRAGGIGVRTIIDTRNTAQVGASEQVARQRETLARAGVDCILDYAVLAARGARSVNSARIAPLSDPTAVRSVACDAILVSGGWTPVPHARLPEGYLAGAANGHLEIGAVLADGHDAGARAARHAGVDGDGIGDGGAAMSGEGDAAPRPLEFSRSPAAPADEKRQFIDLQNDVTVADLRQALAEGFKDIEHVKRYTTLGIGTDQGRTGGPLGSAILAELTGVAEPPPRVSRPRPPYHPVTMQSLAGLRVGCSLRVVRRTPLYDWHAANGAVLETAGLWMRPRYYLDSGSDCFTAGVAEARRVRSSGGILDASTLGKIEVAGPDAAALLDHLYLAKASTLRVGHARYMVNLREDGMVLDDGIVLRMAMDRFRATTSSGHALHMLAHFEHYQATKFSTSAVTITDVTEAWAVIVVAGPSSRSALMAVLGTAWHSIVDRLKHMEFAGGEWEGHDLLVLRASFSGECAFELHCRSVLAPCLWQALVAAGLRPYGLEALDILRVEKGYLTASELNGQTTPYDLGMDALMALGNPCVGRDLLGRPAFHEPDRPRVTGLRAADGRSQFLAGAQLTPVDEAAHACGHVTSSAFSPELGEWIGLALVARSLCAPGHVLMARDPVRHGDTVVRLVPPVHVDPAGTRMKM